MKKNYNLSGNLHDAMERAIYIAEDLGSLKLCTFHIVMAILMEEKNSLQQQYIEFGSTIDIAGMLCDILNVPEIYEFVTGNEFPSKSKEKPEEKSNEEEITDEQSSGNNVIYVVDSSDYINSIMSSYSNIELSTNLELAFEDAYRRCENAGQRYIDEYNLLFSILSIENSSTSRLLKNYGFDISEMKNVLSYNSNIYYLHDENRICIPDTLKSSCEILNLKYTKGQVCEILGRDTEIFEVWNIFSKKTKRNAILVGEAGVGKTAIVEAVTMQIVNGNCPREFKNYSVISLDITSMVAGTKYRGEFEQKVQHLITFLKSTKNIIIFIDEIHQILGAGSAEGSGADFSGSLKPILARDDVVFIGSTTTVEYERYFSVDPAFKRRFEKVEIKEPKLDEVKKMISLKVQNISKYHNISISDDVLDYIIITSKAMNYTGKNPDVTIDLVDRAMAIAKISRSKSLNRKHVDKVNKQNYDMFKSMKKKDKLSTAYHEAGHALVKLLAKYDIREDLKVVSIIPTFEYLGVTITESNNSYSPMTRDAVLEQASMSLAGRVAQEFINKNWDFGASSDLVAATDVIRTMIIKMGMDSNIYTNISLYDYGSSGHIMSPEAVDKVNDRIKEITQKVYEDTKLILTKNKDKLDIIANLLMEKGIISIEEILEAFKNAKLNS